MMAIAPLVLKPLFILLQLLRKLTELIKAFFKVQMLVCVFLHG